MRIKEINNYEDFLTLKQRWKKILQKCDHSIFSTWEWISIWWKHLGKNKRPIILLTEDNDGVLGIAPFMYSVQKMFGLRIGKIEFIGTPNSDYNDFILTEKVEKCIKQMFDYISNNLSEKWDYIELMEIPETTKSLMYLNKISENVMVQKDICSECPYIPLPKSFDILFDGLKAKTRSSLRRAMRRLQENYLVEVQDYSKTEKYKDGMEILFNLHQKRWKSKDQPGIFDEQKVRVFHLDISRSFSEKGWLSLFSLLVDGEPVSSYYGFKYKHKLYAYLSGMDPEYQKFSVGNLLILDVMRNCIKEGLIEFDFLRGEEKYKYRWNSLSRRNYKVIFIKRGLRSRVKILARSLSRLY